VRVLAAEDGVDLDDLLLEVQRLQVMRHRHQVGLGRQLVRWVAPVGVRERPELAGFDELLQPVLQVAEIARRRERPVRDRLRQFGRALGIGLEGRHHIHPVQRVQVIEVHQVVVHVQVQLHQVADGVGVLGNLDRQRILDGAHRGQRMGAGAHAADAFGEGPGIARVTALEDDLQAAPHGAGGYRVSDHVLAVEIHLDPQVALDAADGIDDDALARVVQLESLRFVGTHHFSPVTVSVFFAFFSAEAAACTATAAPATAAAAPPTLSAFCSTPNCLMSVTRS